MPRTPASAAERSMRARLAAYSMHAQHDGRAVTANARAAFEQRFLDEVDPNRVLPEAERARRAEAARKAFYLRLSLASARARRERKDLVMAVPHGSRITRTYEGGNLVSEVIEGVDPGEL